MHFPHHCPCAFPANEDKFELGDGSRICASKGGFKEGVSLTVDDELNRWQKYAYGCNELIFNPLIEWWRRGPINKQLHVFLWSDAPVHYKVTMTSYMFSYCKPSQQSLLATANPSS